MLILLTGAEGIGKMHIARAIMSQMNTFEHDGFSIEYRHSFDGNVEYIIDGNNLTNTDEINPKYTDIMVWASEKYNEVFVEYLKNAHTYDAHQNPDYDIGLTDEDPNFDPTDGVIHDVNVLNLYNNRPEDLDVAVVTGSFSRYYLEMVHEELQDEVKIINITRNPSVAWLLNHKPDSYYSENADSHVNKGINTQKFVDSTIVTGLNTSLDFVESIKFESLINDGLYIDNQKIILGKGYRPHNEYISQYEFENHTQDDLTKVNEALSTFDPLWFDSEINSDYSSKDAVQCINEFKSAVPNIFDLYPDYGPLTYAQITAGAPK